MARYHGIRTEKQKFPKSWERYQYDLALVNDLEKIDIIHKDSIFDNVLQRITALNNRLFSGQVLEITYHFDNIQAEHINYIKPVLILHSNAGFESNLDYLVTIFTYVWKKLGDNHYMLQTRCFGRAYDPITLNSMPEVPIYGNLYIYVKNENIWQSIVKSK